MKNYGIFNQSRPTYKPPVGPQSKRPAILDTLVPKKRILCWLDSPTVTTGFGVVAKNLLQGIHQTGQYEIDVLGINYMGDFYDRAKFPYQIIPARHVANPQDPYGRQVFLDSVAANHYDIILIMNDMFVVESTVKHLFDLLQKKSINGLNTKVVYYYPVDCRAIPGALGMIEQADTVIAYSDFAIQETRKVCKREDIQRMYLGVDTKAFYPLSLAERIEWRRQYLGITDDTFIFIGVARNSPRKDIAKTIYAFNEFHKKYPKSMLYLHTAVRDTGAGTNNIIDLSVPIQHLGLNGKDIIRFPANFHPAKGYSDDILNNLYGCADAFISTHTGEGFGCTTTEAMACKVPVIQPNNTVTPELLGPNDERGYSYPCKEPVLIDSSGYRLIGRLEDIVSSMEKCYLERGTTIQQQKIDKAYQFANSLDWSILWEDWEALLSDTLLKPRRAITTIASGAEL